MRMSLLTPRCRLHGVTLGLLLTLLFWGGLLLQCGDVELNPGPTTPTKSTPKPDGPRVTRQTTLSLERKTSTSGDKQPTPPLSDKQTTPPLGDKQTTPPLDDTQTTPVGSFSIADVMARFDSMENTMQSNFSTLDKSVKDIDEKFTVLNGEVLGLREEVSELRQKNKELTDENTDLAARIDNLERKTDDLEGRSKRNNLIFYGFKQRPNETNDELEGKIQGLLNDKLDMTKKVQFDRVHRLGGKPDSPVIACCSSYKEKVKILKEKKKLKGSTIFIGEDFSTRVREIRRKLSPHLKAARDLGKKCVMIFDHLLVDGKKFFLDEKSGTLKEKR